MQSKFFWYWSNIMSSILGSACVAVKRAEQWGCFLLSATTEYHWGDEAKTYRPGSPYIVEVFKRKAQ